MKNCQVKISLRHSQKKEIYVCDTNGQATVQQWEKNIGLLKDGSSYELRNLHIMEYEEEKHLAMRWDKNKIKEIKQLINIIELPVVVMPIKHVMKKAQIAAVYNLETGHKCLR